MSTPAQIRAILESRLATWAAARVPPLPVLWENARVDTEPTGQHLRAYILPATTFNAYLEGTGRTHQGILQVSAFLVPGTGPAAADAIAAELDALFPCADVLTNGAIQVQIMAPVSALPAMQEPGWSVTVFRVRYRCDASI